MDSIEFYDIASVSTMMSPEVERRHGRARGILLFALIVVVTLTTLIGLDRAGLRPMTEDRLLAAPLLD